MISLCPVWTDLYLVLKCRIPKCRVTIILFVKFLRVPEEKCRKWSGCYWDDGHKWLDFGNVGRHRNSFGLPWDHFWACLWFVLYKFDSCRFFQNWMQHCDNSNLQIMIKDDRLNPDHDLTWYHLILSISRISSDHFWQSIQHPGSDHIILKNLSQAEITPMFCKAPLLCLTF